MPRSSHLTIPVSLLNVFTRTRYSLTVSTSVLPSVAILNGSCFILDARFLESSLAIDLMICVVFVLAHAYFFAMRLSGNIWRNSSPVWSATAGWIECSTKKSVNKTSARITLKSSFLQKLESG